MPRNRTFGLRAGRSGDTPYSTEDYKLTDITVEVGNVSGAAVALNNDGRIAYNNYATGKAYIVNHGGTFGKLFVPAAAIGTQAYALNENAEIVGSLAHVSGLSDTAWRLEGATSSSLAYSSSTTLLKPAEYSVNHNEVAVGQDALGAALFEGASDPPGRKIDLLGLRDATCFSGFFDVAYAINDRR